MENNFFPGQGKIREICSWSGNFGKDLKSGNFVAGRVNLEKSWKLKNKWQWQSSENTQILLKEKGYTFRKDNHTQQ